MQQRQVSGRKCCDYAWAVLSHHSFLSFAPPAELEEDDDDSDDEWTDDEECETAIDPIDPYIHFIDQLGSLQVLNPVRHSALLASVDALGQVAVQGIATIAEKQRLAKAQQANPAVGGKS